LRVLLVEPEYRRLSKKKVDGDGNATDTPIKKKKIDDESLWYPPIGLMKLSTFHKRRGDQVQFVKGCDNSISTEQLEIFSPNVIWDRVYISTLFTYDWHKTVKTINHYKNAVGGSINNIYVGGIMASIMPNEIYEETGIYPVVGILHSPEQIGLEGQENIDMLPPDYDLLSKEIYAINDTYYAYTTRGCTQRCAWCGVPDIEPKYCDYIDIKQVISELRDTYGDKPRLKLMDNNILASPHLDRIVDDLCELNYGMNQKPLERPRRLRVIDFNQGLDATHVNKKTIAQLSRLNIRPVRIAFDRIQETKVYKRSITLAHKAGFREFSNYMLYGYKDTPKDLYQRLMVNIDFNEKWSKRETEKKRGTIYSYPMRYSPIKDAGISNSNRRRDFEPSSDLEISDFVDDAVWTKRFIRNMDIIKGAAHGAIPPTPGLARRALGETYWEFIMNLYTPEEILRNRNDNEIRVYRNDNERKPGSGRLEAFREFLGNLMERDKEKFKEFHQAVSSNSLDSIRALLKTCHDGEMEGWLKVYLKSNIGMETI